AAQVGVRGASPPVHTSVARRGAGAGPPAPPDPADASRRDPLPHRPSVGMPIPPPLPHRPDGLVRRGGPATDGGARIGQPPGGVPAQGGAGRLPRADPACLSSGFSGGSPPR